MKFTGNPLLTAVFAPCVAGLMLAAAPMPGHAQAAEPRSYSADLATLYNEHQRVLAVREACIIAQPAVRAEVEGAYKDWRTRHSPLVDELENRFAALIKRASRDEADFSRNYGKYQAEVLALREENTRAMLAGDKVKLAAECKGFPAYLRSNDSDLPVMYPAQYRNIRRAR